MLHLAEIGELKCFDLFDEVTISEEVRSELAEHGSWETSSDSPFACLQIRKVTIQEINEQAKKLSAFTVHRADLSVAALAARLKPDVVLTDDLRLRRGLESQGYQVVGSVGVLIRAFRVNRLSKSELLIRLDNLLDGSSLYTSKAFRSLVRASLDSLEEQSHEIHPCDRPGDDRQPGDCL